MDPAFSKNRASYLLYLAAAFIAFMPCLLFGQAYFANDLLHYYGPARLLMKNQLAAGHFPLWNPYYFGGEPFFADPNVMACYPLLYLTLLFPLSYGLSVFFFLHMALAAFGMHFWLKSLRLSDGACRLGALTFALSGFFWWELIHPPILAAFAWFPWMMFCLERFSQKLQGGWAFATGLCFALVFCCGNFQSTSCVLYTAFAYFLFRVFLREKEAGAAPFPWKKLLIALLFMAWGGLPLIAHFLPAYEFSKYSNRAESQQDYDHFNGQFSMEPRTTYEFLYPDLGVPQGGTIEAAIQGVTDQVNIGNDFLGAFGYIGVWAPFLFILAFQRKDKKFLLFLAGISVLSIITAWGRYGGLHWLECLVLPGIKLSRAPFRFVQTYVLFGSALLAFGYQTLERWFGEKDRRFNWIWGACAYAVLLFLPALLRADQGWREMLALAVGLAGVLLGLLTNSWRTLGGFAFQAALLLPLLLNGWGSYSTGPSSNYDLETRFPPFTYLKEHRAEARYYFGQDLAYPVQIGSQTVGWPFPQDSPMDFGIRQSGGYNPIVLAKPSRLRSLTGATYFKLMAVKGILTGREMQDSPEFNHQSFGFAHLYEFKTPNPYVAAP
ncbi:MAG TPA: hypothetical protein VJ873_12735, partial [bacterium]|nr:hypothetical protein [bacterium]